MQLLIQSFASVWFLEKLIKIDVRRHTVFDDYAFFFVMSFTMNLIIIVVVIFGFVIFVGWVINGIDNLKPYF
jgi:hypothetical protein